MTEDLVLELSERIRRMLNNATEEGIRVGIRSSGNGDLEKLVDSLDKLYKEAKADAERGWNLVARLYPALEAADAGYSDFEDELNAAKEALATRNGG